jgi:hypothetical protein
MAKRILLVLSRESPAASPARHLVGELLASAAPRGEARPGGEVAFPPPQGRSRRARSTSRGGTP